MENFSEEDVDVDVEVDEDIGVIESMPKDVEELEDFSPLRVPMVETLVEKQVESKDADDDTRWGTHCPFVLLW